MKPIFCGNLDFNARQYDVERIYRKYGKIDIVDLKSGLSRMRTREHERSFIGKPLQQYTNNRAERLLIFTSSALKQLLKLDKLVTWKSK